MSKSISFDAVKRVLILGVVAFILLLHCRRGCAFETFNHLGTPLRWERGRAIDYCFCDKCPQMVRDAARGAMDKWSAAANIRFQPGIGDIKFFWRDDWDSADVILATCAIANEKAIIEGASIEINAQFYKWHRDPREICNFEARRINIDAVLLHEIGHALGLHHSDKRSAIMFPQMIANRAELGADDIAGIRFLYGIVWRAENRRRYR